ncbi:M20 metallopeptidase family protein [Paraliobacillus sediminis]|uniref:M20 metallopeptidase family protein n=1 Tax=Paraliobacillus sediminis TaxID=1885916 RepID=UPI001F079E38|nr:amidohydrolase [Paraliobacillus sediminis]
MKQQLDLIKNQAKSLQEQLSKWRRHFHQYPELSFQEAKTSDYIVEVLESFNVFTIERGIAKHGVIATVTKGSGPVIGIRADMDALPIAEQTDFSYASSYPGVMHACGHDAHMAILLGVAALVATDYQTGDFRGTVKLIFQPAEEDTDIEGKTGASYFVEAGLTKQVDAILALHMCPWQCTGSIQVNKGLSMANVDNFSLTIMGKGGHGGYPHESKDPIWMLGFVLQALYGVISRKVDPLEVGTISIGKVIGGQNPNVIPDTVKIIGTMRSYSAKVRKQLMKELEQVAQLVYSFSGDYQLEIESGEPALDNDAKLIDLIENAGLSLYPNMEIRHAPYGMGGEDFGHFTREIPGAMFFLGCAQSEEMKNSLHASDLRLDEAAFPIGVGIIKATIDSYFREYNTNERLP